MYRNVIINGIGKKDRPTWITSKLTLQLLSLELRQTAQKKVFVLDGENLPSHDLITNGTFDGQEEYHLTVSSVR